MCKIQFNLLDDSFAHIQYISPDVDSKYIVWDRNLTNKYALFFYTHNNMKKVFSPTEISYGLLVESRSIIPKTYSGIKKHIDKFRLVFTHNSYLLKNYSNCRWIPGSGIWIGGNYGGGSIGIKTKDRLCSIVSSDKTMCDLHVFRYKTARNLLTNSNVDVYGFNTGWVPINETLDSYRYSIIIENFVDDLYFTEKILNCFALGTVPIYYGARNINEVFNSHGIITFNCLDELAKIIEKIDENDYASRQEAVIDNYTRCLKFRCLEDFIFENYFCSAKSKSIE